MGHKHGLVKSDYWPKTSGLDEIASHVKAPNVTVLYEILMLIMFKITVFKCNHSHIVVHFNAKANIVFPIGFFSFEDNKVSLCNGDWPFILQK